jgi:hypothetical protein
VQRGIRQRTSGGSRPAAAGCRERTGSRTETESGGLGGTSRQHTVKSSIHYRPSRYTRCSCAERCVFTPGDPHGCPFQRYGRDAEVSPRQRPERSPPEWTRVNGCGCKRAYACRHIATVVAMSSGFRSGRPGGSMTCFNQPNRRLRTSG